MPVTPNAPAPYAPAKAIVELITRHRNRGLPTPVSPEVLARAGISESLIPRTLQALHTLDLIDDNGAPSSTLEGIRLAPEAEYKQRLASWLSAAYADALQYVDPATAPESEIRDAFRNYNPIGQQDRMVTLFTGLFREAGIGPERQRTSGAVAPRIQRRAPTPPPKGDSQSRPATKPPSFDDGKLPPPIAGLLTSLPSNGSGWSEATRDRFLRTFEAVLDYCVPIVEEGRADMEAALAPETINETEEAAVEAVPQQRFHRRN